MHFSNESTTLNPSAKPVRVGRTLLSTVSFGVMATAMTMPINAIAQAVPCSLDPSTAAAGDTINCIALSPATISGFSTTVDDLTVNVGRTDTPTAVTGRISATVTNGTHTLNIVNAGTSVESETNRNYGVEFRNIGSANIIIDSEGSITGSRYGIGIFADLTGGTGTIDITTADVTGSTTISSGAGIFSRSRGAGTTINTTAGDINGARGVEVFQFSDGDISVTTANVTATNGHGIYARSDGGDVEIDTTDGVVTGSSYGIRGRNTISSVESNITITTGNVSSTQRDAVDGRTVNGDVTIDTTLGTIISAQSEGISGYVTGSGSVSITTADVTAATYGRGIFARSRGAASTGSVMVDTTAGTVTAGEIGSTSAFNGIYGQATSDQDVTITTADVTAYSSGAAVEGRVNGGNLDIDTSAGTIYSGASHGIRTRQAAGGDVTIITSDVTGGEGSDGIYTRGYAAGTTTINTNINNAAGEASTITGGRYGIRSVNFTTSAEPSDFNVTTANVTGEENAGIRIITNNGSVSIDSSAGNVEGASIGIQANSNVSGDISIISADVTGNSSQGILATTRDGVVTVDSSAGNVTSTTVGIGATANGDDAVTVITAGVESTQRNGIEAESNGGLITIETTAGLVDGYRYGIYANNSAAGGIKITTADVSSQIRGGIYAGNFNGDGYVSINTIAGTVSTGNGTGIGVYADGDITITTADVTSLNNDGIVAYGGEGQTTIDTTAGVVDAEGYYGVNAFSSSAGSITITTGDVSSNDNGDDYGWAVSAVSEGTNSSTTPTSVSVTSTGDVESGYYGIFTRNYDAYGSTTINIDSGTVRLTNTYGRGRAISSYSAHGTTVTVAAGATVLQEGGYFAINVGAGFGTHDDTVTIAGTVVGQSALNDGDDTFTLMSTGSVDGTVDFGSGDDIFNYNGGSFTLVDGGSGINTVNFNTGFDFTGSSSLPADAADYNSNITDFSIFNFNGGVSNYNDELSADTVSIGSGATLNADGALVGIDVSTFTNSGTLTINGDGIGEFIIHAGGEDDFVQTSSGTTVITVEDGEADLLSIEGHAELDGTLALEQSGIEVGTVTIVEANRIDGEFASVTGLASGLLISQSVEYIDDVTDSIELTSNVASDANSVSGLSVNQAALANALTSQLVGGSFTGDLYDYGIDLISGDTVSKLSEALEEVLPNAGLGGVQVSQNTMGQFSRQLMGQAGTPSGSGIVQTASNNPSFASSAFGNNGGAGNVWGAVHYNTVEGGDTGAGAFDADGYDITAGISGGDMGGASIGAAISFAAYDSDIAGATTDTVESTLLSIGAYASKAINESGAGLNTRLDGAFSYSTGDNDITQSVAAIGATPASTNTASAEITGYSAVAKLTVNGQDGSDWMLKPYLIAGFDSVTQDAYVLGSGAGQLNVGESSADRFNFGYGLSYERDLGDGLLLNASATGLHHTGDTAVTTSTNFAGSTASNSAFATSSSDIETEFILEGGISRVTDNDWALGVSGYAQFGDLEGFGGRIKVGHTF